MTDKGTALFDGYQREPYLLFAGCCYFFLVAVFFVVVFFAPQVLPVLPGLQAIASSFRLQQCTNETNGPLHQCHMRRDPGRTVPGIMYLSAKQ